MMRMPSSFALSTLLPGSAAGEDVIGFFADAAGDVAAERFDFFCGFLARHRRQCAGEHKSLSGQWQFGRSLCRHLFALRSNTQFLHSVQNFLAGR